MFQEKMSDSITRESVACYRKSLREARAAGQDE
jgi:hypothetical protein